MNLPTQDGYTLAEVRQNLAEQTERRERLKRIEAGLEPNTLGGRFPDVRLDEALDDSFQQQEYYQTLLARFLRADKK